MFQFSTAHWCERRIGAASGQAGPEVWPSRTHVQNGKRLAAYGDCALIGLPSNLEQRYTKWTHLGHSCPFALWNTVYLKRATNALRGNGQTLDPSLRKHCQG